MQSYSYIKPESLLDVHHCFYNSCVVILHDQSHFESPMLITTLRKRAVDISCPIVSPYFELPLQQIGGNARLTGRVPNRWAPSVQQRGSNVTRFKSDGFSKAASLPEFSRSTAFREFDAGLARIKRLRNPALPHSCVVFQYLELTESVYPPTFRILRPF